jgi:hypothetical protein
MIELTVLIESGADEKGNRITEPHQLLLNMEEVFIISILETKDGCILKFIAGHETGNVIVQETYEYLKMKLFGEMRCTR